jgi:hypothetical protein
VSALRWLLLVALLPVVAVAQFSPPEGAAGGVCTLDGTQVGVATYFRATNTTGTGFQCDATLDSCVDLGPGARNTIGTNVAGAVCLGPCSGSSTAVLIYGDLTASNTILIGAALDLPTNAFIRNATAGYPVRVNDNEGLQVVGTTTMPACNATTRNAFRPLTFAVNSGTADRLCWCRSANDNAVAASATHRWVNVASGNMGTTDTECPL